MFIKLPFQSWVWNDPCFQISTVNPVSYKWFSPGGRFNTDMPSYQLRNSHYKDKMVETNLDNGNLYTWKYGLCIETEPSIVAPVSSRAGSSGASLGSILDPAAHPHTGGWHWADRTQTARLLHGPTMWLERLSVGMKQGMWLFGINAWMWLPVKSIKLEMPKSSVHSILAAMYQTHMTSGISHSFSEASDSPLHSPFSNCARRLWKSLTNKATLLPHNNILKILHTTRRYSHFIKKHDDVDMISNDANESINIKGPFC